VLPTAAGILTLQNEKCEYHLESFYPEKPTSYPSRKLNRELPSGQGGPSSPAIPSQHRPIPIFLKRSCARSMGFRVKTTAKAKQDLDAILGWLLSQGAGEADLRWFRGLQDDIRVPVPHSASLHTRPRKTTYFPSKCGNYVTESARTSIGFSSLLRTTQ